MIAKKICLVEDTPDLLDNLSQFLRMEGYEIWPCKNGIEAMDRMKKDTPDLIITDFLMPGINGLELIQKLKHMNHLTAVPVALFSAKPLTETDLKAFDIGQVAYIKKPSSLDEILKMIHRLLHD